MAVTVTPKDIYEASYAKSTKNDPGSIASESVELLNLVNRVLQKFFAIGARVNPTYFAEKSTVAPPGAATPWDRPEGAESIFRLENNSDGSEIVVVPFDDRKAEEGLPAVYRLGKKFYEAGNAGDPDPTAVSIDFWYSKRPTSAGTVTSTLDAMWEEQFNELLILEVAIYLALKDRRMDEVAALREERDDYVRQFILFLEHETANERRRHGHLRRINTMSLIPFSDILAGGSSVKLDRGSN